MMQYDKICYSTWCDVHALMSNTEHTRCYEVKRKLLTVKKELDRTKLSRDLVVTWIEHLQGTRHLDFELFQDWKNVKSASLNQDKDTYYSNIEQLQVQQLAGLFHGLFQFSDCEVWLHFQGANLATQKLHTDIHGHCTHAALQIQEVSAWVKKYTNHRTKKQMSTRNSIGWNVLDECGYSNRKT